MKSLSVFALIVIIFVGISSVYAQDPRRVDRYVTFKERKNASSQSNYDVLKRERPEYDPSGKAAGAFKLLPSITLDTGYTDNIQSAPNDELRDFYNSIAPELNIESQFTRHELKLFSKGKALMYHNNEDENINSILGGASGRLDITNDMNVNAEISYLEEDEVRSSANSQINGLSNEPIHYSSFNLKGGINQRINRVKLKFEGSHRFLNYDDGTSSNGVNIDQDVRDMEISMVKSRIAYEFSPNYSAFVSNEYSQRSYELQSNNDRDSSGYRTAAGLKLSLSNLITGEAFLGYMDRDYENAQDVSGIYYGGAVNWYPTPILSIYLEADRDIQDSNFFGTFSKTTTDVALGAAYEFKRNIIISPQISFNYGDYEGIDIREQSIRSGMDIEYLINRNYSVVGSYRFSKRDATDIITGGVNLGDLDYDQNVFTVSIKGRL